MTTPSPAPAIAQALTVQSWTQHGHEAVSRRRRIAEHASRCRRLPPLTQEEAERLVRAFLSDKGRVRLCPTAYAAPVSQ
ncbi:hypothetical protein M0638_20225 [Roseomonas sp. NAR14]|uniref:Uncharacterized protein n=1 Tax=Roseomonas acroporae TaxID=2937791 RepID=A0A9X2BVI2_9PROT|nr:hypothetical protein [Roseomonas acroporae]MCK8786703.1 hypothetical protein [Roseomonas acroporae]